MKIKLVKNAEDCEVVASSRESEGAAATQRKVAMMDLESLCAALEEQLKRPYPRWCALFVVESLSASSDAGDCADAPSDGPAGRIRWKKINFWWSEKGLILTSGDFKFCVDGVCFKFYFILFSRGTFRFDRALWKN